MRQGQKQGVTHWRWQRISAIIVLPCSLWFVLNFIPLYGADYGSAIFWMDSTTNKIFLVVSVGAIYIHGLMGMQVVLEDYTREPIRSFLIWSIRIFIFFTSLALVYLLFFKL